MAKSPEMEKFLNKFTEKNFGRSRHSGVCVFCGSTKVEHCDFRDAISRREYEIFCLCQKCQDQTFGTVEEELEYFSSDINETDRYLERESDSN